MDVNTFNLVGIIGVSGVVAVMLLATLGCITYLIIRAFRAGGTKRSGKTEAEETRLIQEIHHGLVKMERRVESLETLLLDADRTKRSRFDRELSEE